MGVIIPVWWGGGSWENAKATGDDYETKLAAVRDHVEHGLTKAEVMEKYRSRVPPRWSAGAASTGLAAGRAASETEGQAQGREPSRGRLPQGNSLEEENAYLKARVAYLKVDALLAWRSATGTER